jgi:hypothetical protein
VWGSVCQSIRRSPARRQAELSRLCLRAFADKGPPFFFCRIRGHLQKCRNTFSDKQRAPRPRSVPFATSVSVVNTIHRNKGNNPSNANTVSSANASLPVRRSPKP